MRLIEEMSLSTSSNNANIKDNEQIGLDLLANSKNELKNLINLMMILNMKK